MAWLRRFANGILVLLVGGLASGCTTSLVLVHLHDKLTEGDPPRCDRLNSVERALRPRCGEFVPGSIAAKDVAASGLPECPLTIAAREPRHWRVLPELLARGAAPEACAKPPLVALAQAQPCPDFTTASVDELAALRWLALADARAIHHDAVRLLSCPNARAVGLDGVLDTWLALQLLPARGLAFGALAALHPGHLHSDFAQRLEAQGHHARTALGGYVGELPSGFELALHTGDWQALDWWLVRAPELVNGSPPARGGQLPWLPLARVLTPNYVADEELRRSTVEYLLAHGADPWRRLPQNPGLSVVGYAREVKSPLLGLLDPPYAGDVARSAAQSAAPQNSRAQHALR
jgi:hypothetical protein